PEAPVIQRLLSRFIEADCGLAAMEVSSIALALHRADAIPYRVAVFTNLSRDHLDFHGGMDEYLEAKARLFRELVATDGTAILPTEGPGSEIPVRCRRTWQFGQGGDLRAENACATLQGTTFDAHTPMGTRPLSLRLLGGFNVSNALAALGAALALDLPLDACIQGLSELAVVPGRLEPVPNPLGLSILVDYAHTPEALSTVLGVLGELTPGRIFTVFGCGGDRDPGKRPMMGRAASRGSHVAVVTSDNPRSEDPQAIIGQIVPGVEGNHVIVPDRKEAIAHAVSLAGPDDVVLIAGKGHERTQDLGDRIIPFDDRTVALQACEVLQ
ncbi:MAG: UDP-N-acetylmuramoyl-L-alanyl-D-glutamate--2,6-diaminopimelate ligase, partial [Myxococcota bacterium]|nr:UDP-N-acetylmuramoyl-L-alanyl-D-glutamate--2,6-diaminopimelate ligase [Myxococcota bacterium]